MKQHKALRTLTFGLVLGGSVIAFTGVAHADCPAGFQNNMDTNISTGITTYFCTPLGDQNIAQYDSNITPNAPVATPEIDPPAVQAVVAPVVADTPYVVPFDTDPNDPFPLLQVGDMIPDTSVDGDQAIVCPDGSGRGIAYNVTTHTVTTSCVKTYTTPVVPVVDPTIAVVTDPTVTPTVLDPTVITDATVSPVVTPPVKLGGLAGTSARGD